MNAELNYEKDFQGWLEHQITLLRTGRLNEIDVTHLIEELQDMGKNNKQQLVNRFIVLIAHLLKWQYQYEQLAERWESWTGQSWKASIIEQRVRIGKLLKDNPSLKHYLNETMTEAYVPALEIAIYETELPQSRFPEVCPYSIEQLLDKNFYPIPI